MATTKKRKKRPVKAKAKRPAKRKARRRPRKVAAVKRKAVKRRKPAKRKRRSTGRKVVKQVERSSVERVLTGKRKRRSSTRRKRRVVMAGSTRRRRRVGGNGGGGMKWLLPVALGAGVLYLLSKKNPPATPGGVYQLPPLTNTQNQVRNNQSQDLINYAVAGGLALDAILKLIDRLNSSNDQEVQNIYDVYHTTGNLDGVYV